MRTKNAAPIDAAERAHLELVKLLQCGLCGAGGGYSAPSEAHHIEQGRHFTAIPLCASCHRGPRNGLHGQRIMWSIMKKTEMSVLNDTIRRLYATR